MDFFRVGMIKKEYIGLPDGLVMEWVNHAGLVLYVNYRCASRQEIKDVSAQSRFEIRFKDIGGIGFFSIKFGQQPWSDCCFSPNMYDEHPILNPLPEGQTYPPNIIFIDTLNGQVKTLRTIALGKEFAEYFRQWCINSLERKISRQYYNSVIDQTFLTYKTPADLAKAADVVWTLEVK